MSKFLYLLVDLLSIALPLVFSFYKRPNFSSKWKFLWPAIFISATVFILWDMAFTRMGIWGFNPKYITGIYLRNLPIEEVLFFICIPYSCVFLYQALKHFFKKNLLQRYAGAISVILSASLLSIGIMNLSKWYTSVAFIACAIGIIISQWKWKSAFMGRFYFAYLFTLLPFFIVNGILTGGITSEPVVWYNENEFSGLRMGTIPIEDTFFGLLLILVNISLFEGFQAFYKNHLTKPFRSHSHTLNLKKG